MAITRAGPARVSLIGFRGASTIYNFRLKVRSKYQTDIRGLPLALQARMGERHCPLYQHLIRSGDTFYPVWTRSRRPCRLSSCIRLATSSRRCRNAGHCPYSMGMGCHAYRTRTQGNQAFASLGKHTTYNGCYSLIATQITLAAPRPLPEKMIAANPHYYYEFTFSSWRKDQADMEWVRDGVNAYLDPEKGYARIAAACEDVSEDRFEFERSYYLTLFLSLVSGGCYTRRRR